MNRALRTNSQFSTSSRKFCKNTPKIACFVTYRLFNELIFSFFLLGSTNFLMIFKQHLYKTKKLCIIIKKISIDAICLNFLWFLRKIYINLNLEYFQNGEKFSRTIFVQKHRKGTFWQPPYLLFSTAGVFFLQILLQVDGSRHLCPPYLSSQFLQARPLASSRDFSLQRSPPCLPTHTRHSKRPSPNSAVVTHGGSSRIL